MKTVSLELTDEEYEHMIMALKEGRVQSVIDKIENKCKGNLVNYRFCQLEETQEDRDCDTRQKAGLEPLDICCYLCEMKNTGECSNPCKKGRPDDIDDE